MKDDRLFLLLTMRQRWVALSVGLLLAAVFAPWYYQISSWIGVALFIIGVVTVHLSFTARLILILPHIAILVAALQYVLAAWVSYYFPPTDPIAYIGARLPLYLSYAVPCIVALTIGWMIALSGLRPRKLTRVHSSGMLLFELDVMVVLGVGGVFLSNFVQIASLSFVLLLISNLRYVGVYGRMLARGPGWAWRLAIVVAFEVCFAATSTMFQDLLLWGCWTFAIWLYCFTPKPRTIVAAVVGAFILLPSLQLSKWQMREAASYDKTQVSHELGIEKAGKWLSYVGADLVETTTFNLNEDFLAEMLVRYNQGWIVNRVMAFVPDSEPYAAGSTLKNAAVATLLPRVIASDKMIAGGQENMLRYAGVELNENTAMTLGYAGEMYANFGFVGGVIGCGMYALGLGWLFRALSRRAFNHPLWWSLVPYIFYSALKAEDDIALVFNWMVKGCVILCVVIALMPHFRRALMSQPAPVLGNMVARRRKFLPS